MRVLVTGIGRSGTKYAAQLLTNAGLPCGHEAAFGPRTESVTMALERLQRLGLQGDASWYAAPFIAQLPAGVAVCHQIRHPKSWIASWCAPRTPEALEFLRRHAGSYSHTPAHAAELWLTYNLSIYAAGVKRGAYVAYRPREAPRVLADALGIRFKDMRHADGATPKNVNHRKHSSVTLKQVPGELVLDLRRAWEEFGFQW